MGERQEPKPRCVRRSIRFPTSFNATLICGNIISFVEVRDLSSDGALIRGSVLPDEGSILTLSAEDMDAVAELVWKYEGKCGVRFHTSIDPLAIIRKNVSAYQTSFHPKKFDGK